MQFWISDAIALAAKRFRVERPSARRGGRRCHWSRTPFKKRAGSSKVPTLTSPTLARHSGIQASTFNARITYLGARQRAKTLNSRPHSQRLSGFEEATSGAHHTSELHHPIHDQRRCLTARSKSRRPRATRCCPRMSPTRSAARSSSTSGATKMSRFGIFRSRMSRLPNCEVEEIA